MQITTRRLLTVCGAAFAAAVLIGASIAEAQRAGRGGSIGSRGSHTNTAPPPTATAPAPAQPMQRTTTQPGPGQVAQGARPAAPAAAAAPSFGRSLMTGIGVGLLGAGVFGLLSGSGFFAGLGSLAGFFGFLLQALLIGGLIYLVIRLVRGRSAQPAGPAMAGVQRMGQPAPDAMQRQAMGMAGAGAATAVAETPVQIEERDFTQFEQGLYAIQAAYGRGDVGALRLASTPEIASYFEEEISGYKQRNQEYRIGEVKLLQGDLSEAWGERDAIYATVAMRYSIFAATYDHNAKRFVEGDPNKPQEVTELWTFRAEHGPVRHWKLSAIQQVAA
jgi:predicted lipid-binding transport protein (Tim44 family)